jgi:hypothetical protein
MTLQTVWTWVTKNKWLVSIPVLLLLIWSGYKACGVQGLEVKIAKLEGENTEITKRLLDSTKQYEELKTSTEKKNAVLEKEKQDAVQNSIVQAKKAKDAETRIGLLEGQLDSTNGELETQGSVKDAIIQEYKVNLVPALKAQIVEKDRVIFSLTEQYNGEHNLRLKCELNSSTKDEIIKNLTLQNNLKDKEIHRLTFQAKLGGGGTILFGLGCLALAFGK